MLAPCRRPDHLRLNRTQECKSISTIIAHRCHRQRRYAALHAARLNDC